MSTYLESVRTQSKYQIADKAEDREKRNAEAIREWAERMTPLEDRVAKLLSTIPTEIKSQGLSLPAIRNLLAGKWRGKCHPGELGAALRKLGYQRRRAWSTNEVGFTARWFFDENRI